MGTGNYAVLQMAPMGSSNYTTLSGIISGLDNFDRAVIDRTRTIPGGGGATEFVGARDGNASFGCDRNANNAGVLDSASGQYRSVRYYPDGLDGGAFEFIACAQVSKTMGAKDAVRFAVELAIFNEPTGSV